MNLTYDMLVKKRACGSGLEYFKKHFKDGTDIWEVIKHLEEIKTSKEWTFWLFRNFKLTGICRNWYLNRTLWHENNYKNGEKDGVCKSWYSNGILAYEYNFKNGLKEIIYINKEVE